MLSLLSTNFPKQQLGCRSKGLSKAPTQSDPVMALAQRALASTAAALSKPAAWEQYFPACEFQQEDRKAQLAADLVTAFQAADGTRLLVSAMQRYTETACVLLFSCEELLASLPISDDVEAALRCQPDEALQCLAAAAHEVRCF